MMYYSNKARETAKQNIQDLIVKVAEIPGNVLSYGDAGNLIHYLQTMRDELDKEIREHS